MTNEESNQDAVTTLRLMAEAAQQLALLELLKNLLKTISQGDIKPNDIAPTIKTLNEYAKARFNDPTFRHTWERISTSLTKASEREGCVLGITMPTEVSSRYITLIDDMNRELARLDELISQP